MNLTHKDWLQALVAQVGEARVGPLTAQGPVARVRAGRRHLSARLANLGFLYGTPLLPAGVAADQSPAERHFLALMAGLARLGNELAALLGRPLERREADLAVPFLALAGLVDEAVALSQAQAPGAVRVRKALAKAAGRLAERADARVSDPVYGVPLHNGITYVDAWTFGRMALVAYAEPPLRAEATERRLGEAARHKAALAEALVQLAWAGRPPGPAERRAISRQITGLDLPRARARGLRAGLLRPSSAADLAGKVRGREHRRFVLAQAILASLVDGRRSPLELAFLRRLAEAFRFSKAEVSELELELAAFYAEHREYVDTFTAGEAGLELADELVDGLAIKVERNLAAVVKEVKQTGELAELLTKAARGTPLSAEEKAAVRRDLIDVAKAVPSLALAAAPGGLLLLAALAKVLPFNILPSAFVEPPVGPAPGQDKAAG